MQPASAAKLLYPLRGGMVGPLRTGVPRLLNPAGRLHIPPNLSFADFTAQINERQVDYVALNLGVRSVDRAEVLVRGDADLAKLKDLLTEWPMGTPVTVYTVSPRTHTAYYSPLVERISAHRIAVFPPYISEQLLERAVPDGNGLKVLTARDAFFACSYRAAYMEAVCCDWQSGDFRCKTCVAYEAQVRRMAATVGITLPDTLTPQSLDQLLHAHGWRPPLDLLERATRWAPWIRDAFPELDSDDEESRIPGLAVFFLRELALQNGWKPQVLATLAENGFELLLVKDLDEESRERASRLFRGGDWGAVNLAVSGGPPACVVVGLDLLPRPVTAKYRERQPDADNDKIILAKEAARKLVKANLPKNQAFNPVHTTDSSRQAWTAIRLLLPEHEEELHAKVRECRSGFTMNGVVRHLTSYGCRAKADLIDLDGKHAVRKAFPPSAMPYMQREIEVREELGPLCPEIPKLLERGSNFLIVEHVEQDVPVPKSPRPLPFWAIRQLAAFIKTCVARGFDPIDLKPRDNVVLTSSGIRIVDFESWRRCDPATPPENCVSLTGLPADTQGRRDSGAQSVNDPWATEWFPNTALSLNSFLYDPAWLQRLKQVMNLGPRYAGWITRELRRRILPKIARQLGRLVLPKKTRSALQHAFKK